MANSSRTDLTDKFYTKEEVATRLLEYLDLESYDCIIEPSAGNGSFSMQIENCISLDIDPAHEDIREQDFFDFEFDGDPRKTLVIGNPPFGRQGSMALRFINKAAKISHTIAFILPKSFKKVSVKKRVPEYFHLEREIDIGDDSFIYQGDDYKVPCVFQIWVRKDVPRISISHKERPHGFTYVGDLDQADIAVRRVGVYAGDAFLEVNDKSKESHYFLVFVDQVDSDVVVEKLNNTSFEEAEYTSGPPSLSKRELNKKLSSIIENELGIQRPKFW